MNTHTPEITIRALFLAVILAIVLAAANAYLGLKVGLTVSASIPAAILSMGILRFFKNSNILENNIVQTGASAGESLVGGTAFILPALLILHYWKEFNYWQTACISLIGGILGVIFSIPLRRVLLEDKTLRFPEGTAIGQVLQASQEGKGHFRELVHGGIIGGAISLFQTGFQLIADNILLWFKTKTIVYGLTLGFEPALLAAGYIVGINVALSTLLGVVLGWLIGIPVASYYAHNSIAHLEPASAAIHLWQAKIRPVGVGTMLIGGLWTIVLMFKPIVSGLRSSFASLAMIRKSGYQALPKYERDIPIHYAFGLLFFLLIPLYFLLAYFTQNTILTLPMLGEAGTLVLFIVFALVVSFFFSSLCGYFAGLIGSSQSPISSVSLSVLLLAALLLLGIFNFVPEFTSTDHQLLIAEGFTIILGTLVSSACAISNNTIQDLKAGQIVGATPWKQQVILILGVIVSALILPAILQLLFQAYGIGGISPPGRHINPSQMLSAPQAMLMANLASGAFRHNLPWHLISIGFMIAVVCILIDYLLKPRGMRLLVLAVGCGIYLPLDTSAALIAGGVAAYFVENTLRKKQHAPAEAAVTSVNAAKQRGLTLACGLVAGSCLMGVFLAIPFTLAQSTDVLKLAPAHFKNIAAILGLISALSLLAWIYKTVLKSLKPPL